MIRIRPRTLPGLCIVFLALAVSAGYPAHAELKTAITAYRAGDYKKAFENFVAAAKTGDPVAQYNIGVMYLTGRGVAKDPGEAVRWHRNAADNGLAIAQYGLGVMHYKGEGVKKDFSEAAKWFREAAHGDYADAQFNLGVMHFNGQGVRRDMSEVVKWISLAAGKGHKNAMYRMAVMYEKGDPFHADTEEALRWYGKAAARGHEIARARVEALGGRISAAPLAGTTPPKPIAQSTETAIPVAAASTAKLPQPDAEAVVKPPAPHAAATVSAWRVQLASFRSIDEAKRAWRALKKRHAGLLGGLTPAYGRADLGRKGIYHRLRAGPLASRAAARTLCADIRKRASTQGCLPVRPRR